MGAFALYRNNYINEPTVKEVFIKKGFTKHPHSFNLGDRTLLYYPKIRETEPNWIQVSDYQLVGVGTIIYSGVSGQQALYKIYEDFLKKKFYRDNVIGDYVILLSDKTNKIQLFTSPSYSYNIFYDTNENIISSSFLAVAYGVQDKIQLNRNAIMETLLTGNLIGPETHVKQILRLEKHTKFHSKELIHIQNFISGNYTASASNFSDAVDEQLNVLKEYAHQVYPIINKSGAALGITGGLDSRLLLSIFISNKENLQAYSTWRKNITKEFSNAALLLNKMNLKMDFLKHTPWYEMKENHFNSNIEKNFWFNDGLIRTHQIWFEEIKSSEYWNRLILPGYFNTSGVGGEQYRNQERLKTNGTYNYNNWLTYEVLFKYINAALIKSKVRNDLLDYVKNKIDILLNCVKKHEIGFYEIKRYYNEIYNPANRTNRNNVENQLYRFLSPFTDFKVSQKAYGAIPWLGYDFEFEKEMITRSNKEMAKFNSDYGFAPIAKVPLKQRAISYTKRLIPPNIYYDIYHYRKKSYGGLQSKLKEICPSIIPAFQEVYALNLPIDLQYIDKNAFLSPMILETGYLIQKLKGRLIY